MLPLRLGRSAVAPILLVAAAVPCALRPSLLGAGALGSTDKTPKEDAALLRGVCGSCHPVPPPDILPRAAWRAEIEKMELLREDKDFAAPGAPRVPVVLPPDMERLLAFYEAKAPPALPPPAPWPAPETGRFVRRSLSFPNAVAEPAVANVRLADLDGDPRLELLVSDMRQGVLLLGRPYDPSANLSLLAEVPHPVHAEVVDLDRDGVKDLIVADLGEFYPGDHEKGAVAWLKGRKEGGYALYTQGGFPRVADVEAADFDGDGKLDLVVAAFGWRRTGEIDVLYNRTTDAARPVFERKKVDARAGPIHVIPADLDGDGRMDFVALLAQHYESVVAFLNQGPEKGFRQETIYAGPHPNWGSTGIQLVDLDGDGDLDVLMTNGDMFDDRILKPYHGIQWLENRGRYPFAPHLLATLPGVHRAVAADLDGDGDLDIVACVFTAGPLGTDESRLPSLVWLEQTKPGRFERHVLEVGNPTHATLDAGDYDRDGDVDVVAGIFTMGRPAQASVDVWENQGAGRPAGAAKKGEGP